MAKPTVRIERPAALTVGEEHAIGVEVTTDRPTRVDWIDARLEGQQGWAIGGGKSRVAVDTAFPSLTVRLMEAGELPTGVSRFTTNVRLRPGTAPSHDLDPAYARLRLDVDIALPWKFDFNARFELPVRLPPPAHVERTPVIVRSPARAAPGAPRLELSLASSRVIAGEVVVGSLAVFHVDDRKPRVVELAFVPVLRLHGRGRVRERRAAAVVGHVTLAAGSAGTATSFELRLPATLVPSFETVSHALDWQLVASTGSLFGVKLEVGCPIAIVDAAAAATTARLTEAPCLADAWIETLFTVVAARAGWRLAPPGPGGPGKDEGRAIVRAVDGGEVAIAYAYRGEAGAFLVARIEHARLGLGLQVAPGSTLRHLFWRDVEVDIAAWDRAHLVSARTPAQAVPFLRAAVPALMAAAGLGALVRWDDSALVIERPVATIREATMMEAIGLVEGLAAAIDAARAAIAPPPDLAVELAAWRELATWLDGALAVGDLSIDGALAELPVAVRLRWHDERPVAVRATVGDPALASDALRPIVLRLACPLADMLAADVPAAVVDCVGRWPVDIVDVEVVDGVAAGSLRLPAEGPIAVDAARVRELVGELRALLAAASPSHR